MFFLLTLNIFDSFSSVSVVDFEQVNVTWKADIHALFQPETRVLNPFRPNPGRREKINLNFYFHTSLWCLKWFYEDLKGLLKTFWGTTKKYENEN